jgi:hypothetical protein
MSDDFEDDEQLQRYLLGQAAAEERSRIEERFLADEDLFQHLLIVEDELRYAYASGSLSAADRTRFEQRFLMFADERRAIDETRSFVAALSATPQASLPGVRRWRTWPTYRFALAAAAIVVLSVLSWQTFEAMRLRSELARLQADAGARDQEQARQSSGERSRLEQLDRELQDERRTRARLEQELARQQDRPPGATTPTLAPVLSLFLTAGRTRATGSTQTVSIRGDAGDLRLRLEVESLTDRRYEVEILNADGVRLWSRTGLAAIGRVVVLEVPTRGLPQDDYELRLTAVTPAGERERAGDYYFRVLRP